MDACACACVNGDGHKTQQLCAWFIVIETPCVSMEGTQLAGDPNTQHTPFAFVFHDGHQILPFPPQKKTQIQEHLACWLFGACCTLLFLSSSLYHRAWFPSFLASPIPTNGGPGEGRSSAVRTTTTIQEEMTHESIPPTGQSSSGPTDLSPSTLSLLLPSPLLLGVRWSPRWEVWMQKVDHCSIFLMVTGALASQPL